MSREPKDRHGLASESLLEAPSPADPAGEGDRYRRIVEAVPMTLYKLDIPPKGGGPQRLYISPQVEAGLGIPQQRFIDDPHFWIENIHPDDRARVVDAITASKHQPLVDLQYRATRADGTHVWVRNLGTRYFDETGRPRQIVGVVLEIDELRRTHEELRVANRELRELADQMNRAREQAEQRANELAALNRVASALTNVTDLQASLNLACRELTEVFDTRGCTVTLIDEQRKRAAVVAEYFTDPTLPSVIGLAIPLETPAWTELDRRRTAIVIERPDEDARLGDVREVMRKRAVSQLLVAPLISRGQLIGNMSVSHVPGRGFAPNEVALALTLAAPLAQAIENARLYTAAHDEIFIRRQAELELEAKNELLTKVSEELERANQELARLSVTDVLTGIPNRRKFHDVFDSEWRRAQRNEEPLSMLMIDVDYFKQFNDAYGHQAGDECLARVAQALQSGLHRASDFIARYGGEEFVVIMPNTELAVARAHAQRLCELVRNLRIPHYVPVPASAVTVSVGCAAIRPASDTSPAALISAADHALYQAKDAGRDRVA